MKIFILAVFSTVFFSCAAKKEITVKYNHIEDESRISDSLQHKNFIEFNTMIDDEFEVIMRDNKIEKLTPENFKYEYELDYRAGRVYFYCPKMSEYMQDNEIFTFNIIYKKYDKKK